MVEKQWNDKCNKALSGKKIKNVRYMTEKEASDSMWSKRPLVIFFTDGTYIYASSDDEGNDGGSLFTNIDELSIIPVL